MKRCPRCGNEKPLDAFNKSHSSYDGVHGWCRQCNSENRRRDEFRTKRVKKLHDDRTGWARLLLHCAKQRAKKHGLPFNLELSDIVIPERCPIFGVILQRSKIGGTTTRDNSPSLDKVVPHLGYVKGNVRVISMRANRVKDNANAAEHRLIADYIDRSLEELASYTP